MTLHDYNNRSLLACVLLTIVFPVVLLCFAVSAANVALQSGFCDISIHFLAQAPL